MNERLATDEPKQFVRKVMPGELLPFYSIDVLLHGVCHIVRKPKSSIVKTEEEEVERARTEAQRRGGAKGIETQRRLGIEKLQRYEPRLRDMLKEGLANKDISAKIGLSGTVVQRLIDSSPELKSLSRQRRAIRGRLSAQNILDATRKAMQAAGERFDGRLPMMEEMIAQGRTNKEIGAKFGICERLVIKYISKSPELQALSKQRTEARKGSAKKLDQLRGKIAELQAAGKKGKAIARALGMNAGNVWKYMKMIESENKNV